MKTTLSRRMFLHGATGGALALPLLGDVTSAAAQAAPFPKRLVVVFTPNGTIPSAWASSGAGASFKVGTILQPFVTAGPDHHQQPRRQGRERRSRRRRARHGDRLPSDGHRGAAWQHVPRRLWRRRSVLWQQRLARGHLDRPVHRQAHRHQDQVSLARLRHQAHVGQHLVAHVVQRRRRAGPPDGRPERRIRSHLRRRRCRSGRSGSRAGASKERARCDLRPLHHARHAPVRRRQAEDRRTPHRLARHRESPQRHRQRRDDGDVREADASHHHGERRCHLQLERDGDREPGG